MVKPFAAACRSDALKARVTIGLCEGKWIEVARCVNPAVVQAKESETG
jgi:hypothetical protein